MPISRKRNNNSFYVRMKTKKKLGVAFLWHMHQPFYKDPLEGKYMMPWVRLHGIKDYYPMAALVDEFDTVKVSFNMVPSLVEQLNDYTRLGATDTFLDLTLKKAGALDFGDKVDILNNFFKVNFKRFIGPSDRYSGLLMKKGLKPLSGAALKSTVKGFSESDFIDLQVLFNLSWFHSISIDDDINLKDLVAKGSGYEEEDKEYVVLKQREILSQILPLYRKLQDERQIEITTTPYYHPILPLLCDTSIARVSSPHIRLPKNRFAHAEDAKWQIGEAVKYHTEQFGQPPKGMWPSEGSVSEEALAIMMSNGLKWVATDEDILFNSLSNNGKKNKALHVFDRSMIYTPFRFKKGDRHINMIFRDKNLSNLISFNYNSWKPEDAAQDLIGHLKKTAENIKADSDEGLLTIVMDGENAWEYYPDNGRKFFESLYSAIDKQEDVYSTTVSAYLEGGCRTRNISNIFPGSWINHNFEIWIGEDQDNLAWEYLFRVRQDLVGFEKESRSKGTAGQAKFREAWKEFYIAEGSDWNWWYTGKVRSGNDNPFDELYRTHLKNIYKILNRPVPDFLKISIA